MSSIDLGNQEIWVAYLQTRTTEQFNQYLNKAVKPGVYDGAELSVSSGTIINIAAFEAFINTSTNQLIKAKTNSVVNLELNESQPYIAISYEWQNAEDNYLDFEALASSGVMSNHIVLGKAVFSDPDTIDEFVYDEKTFGAYDEDYNLYVKDKLYIGNNRANQTHVYNIQTDDGELTGLASLPLENNKVYLIESKVTAKYQSGVGSQIDCASFMQRRTYVKDSTSGIVDLSPVESDYEVKTNSLWNHEILGVDPNIEFYVQGSSGTIVNWTASVFVQVA